MCVDQQACRSQLIVAQLLGTGRTETADTVVQSVDLALSEVVQMLVLRQSVHHSPTLLPQHPHLIKNGNGLIVPYLEPQLRHGDEGARPAHPRTAVHHRHTLLRNAPQQLIQQKVNMSAPLAVRDLPIGPIRHLVMRDHPRRPRLRIDQLQLLGAESLLGRRVEGLLEQGDLVLLLGEGGLRLLREVAVALDLGLLNQVAEHEDRPHVVELHHAPEVVESRSEGPLRGDHPLPPHPHHVGVDVVLDLLLLEGGTQPHPGGVEGHEGGVAVEGELLWVLVQLGDVVLRLRHEDQQLELGGEAAFEAVQSEVDLRDLLAQVPQLLVFLLPLLRNIVVRHPFGKYYRTPHPTYTMSHLSRSQQNRTNRRRKDCPCAAIKEMPRGWNSSPCPFGRVRQNEGEIRTLLCDCGREVGEIVFAGEDRVGEWRVREGAWEANQLAAFGEYISLTMPRRIEQLLQKIVNLENYNFRIKSYLDRL